jgi:hypothetical protein
MSGKRLCVSGNDKHQSRRDGNKSTDGEWFPYHGVSNEKHPVCRSPVRFDTGEIRLDRSSGHLNVKEKTHVTGAVTH